MPNGVIGNTTDSGSVKSRFEPWLGNKKRETRQSLSFFVHIYLLIPRHEAVCRRDLLICPIGSNHMDAVVIDIGQPAIA